MGLIVRLIILLIFFFAYLTGCGGSLTSDEDLDALARVKSALAISGETKLAVTEYRAAFGRWPDEKSREKLYRANGDLSNPFQIHVRKYGKIEIIFGRGSRAHPLEGKSLMLVPAVVQEGVRWSCVTNDVPEKYLPDCVHESAS